MEGCCICTYARNICVDMSLSKFNGNSRSALYRRARDEMMCPGGSESDDCAKADAFVDELYVKMLMVAAVMYLLMVFKGRNMKCQMWYLIAATCMPMGLYKMRKCSRKSTNTIII